MTDKVCAFREKQYLPYRVPDYLIIGSQRSGTTSLYRYLTQHPCIRPATRKEIHFFDDHYHLGIDWYCSHFYPVKLFRGLLTGEASPYYFFHPAVPGRVWETFPAIKLLLLLRNPVDRAYSHYHHNIRRKREVRSFEEAVAQEPRLLEGVDETWLHHPKNRSEDHKHYSYLAHGVYIDQLKRWTSFFHRKHFLIIKSEHFFHQSESVLEEIFNFLGVKMEKISLSRHPDINRYTPMNPETRKKLIEYFQPFNQQLYRFLGVDFDWETSEGGPQ